MSFNVGTAFEKFCSSLKMSQPIQNIISRRYHAITKRINNDYWRISSDITHSLYVGSYGRDTEIYSSDIDMLIQLPYETYVKYNNYSSNDQSVLLQEVKRVIEKTYSTTNLKADGQIISIPFTDGIDFEVLPAFLNRDGTYTFANTNNGGTWKITDPKAEIEAINNMDKLCNHNLKRLCKMARSWKAKNNVDISGILIDILAYKFLSSWEYQAKSFYYYDWMSRDFFEYISEIKNDNNIESMLTVESLCVRKKHELYEYLKSNSVLYAGGEISDDDIEKVRNVMISLWLKAVDNNKKYGR